MPNQRSAIESLPPEAQDQIISWLEVESRRKVLARIALQPPEGFGLKTHLTTLSRFFARYLALNRQDNQQLAAIFAPESSKNPFQDAADALASDWAFQIATKPRRNLGAFKALSRWLLKQRELEQRERQVRLLEERLAFDRERYEFDIARTVLVLQTDLAEISKDNTLEEEDKINKARSLVFKRPISELPPRIVPGRTIKT